MERAQLRVFKYTLLPGFLPRIYALFGSGFGQIPYLMALIYQGVGLLPRSHPYLDPKNIGRYGIRHVIAQAANNLVISTRNIDQIAVFSLILTGVVMLFMQLALFGVALFAHHDVLAMPVQDLLMETPVNPALVRASGTEQDLAFILLDRIFGMKNIFMSCISTGAVCKDMHGNALPAFGAYPSTFHTAFHALLRFYSLGIFNIAVLIVVYYIITIAGETATTGIPFGQRFNKAWAPIRLIVCFGLLVPLNTGGSDLGPGKGTNAGLNAAQIITFWVAKTGSNFATNGWMYFNSKLAKTYAGDEADLVGKPNFPKVNDLVKFMYLVKTCQIAENYAYGHKPDGVQAYIVREPTTAKTVRIVPGADAIPFGGGAGTDFLAAWNFSNMGNILVRFGVKNDKLYEKYKGHVKPLCGDLMISGPVARDPGKPPAKTPSYEAIQGLYYDLVDALWTDAGLAEYGACMRDQISQEGHDPKCKAEGGTSSLSQTTIQSTIQAYQDTLESNLPADLNDGLDWAVPPELLDRGWAGAGIWYNRIAQYNGDIVTAAFGMPQPVAFPYVMEVVAEQRRMNNENLNTNNLYDPQLASDQEVDFPRDKDRTIAEILDRAYASWQMADSYSEHFTEKTNSPVLDTINYIFGTSGIFSMRKNTKVHPLAQLSIIGRGLMEAALRNFIFGTSVSFGSALISGADPFAGALMGVLSRFMSTFGSITLSMGFVLYYILPFMPFIYFMFGVTGWVKSIFEAIIAMPLWALAHLRIDGNGLPGPFAVNGYFLLLEILIRPILIIFGLLASIQIFSALVAVMNDIFDLVTANLTGFDTQSELAKAAMLPNKRGPIDEFFFTVLYVVMCYMMGLGCFKLIDSIPNNILRWIGISVSTFSESGEGVASQVTERAYQGATVLTGQISNTGQLAVLLGR